jgi:hypothetical protein
MLHHPGLVPIKVCEQGFPIIHYFDISPSSIFRHKLRWKNGGDVSEFHTYTSRANIVVGESVGHVE